jgi:hypothetical protein
VPINWFRLAKPETELAAGLAITYSDGRSVRKFPPSHRVRRVPGALGGFLGLALMNRFLTQSLDVLTMLLFYSDGTVGITPFIVHQASTIC